MVFLDAVRRVPGFVSSLLLGGYGEPKIFPYQILQFCPINAGVRQLWHCPTAYDCRIELPLLLSFHP